MWSRVNLSGPHFQCWLTINPECPLTPLQKKKEWKKASLKNIHSCTTHKSQRGSGSQRRHTPRATFYLMLHWSSRTSKNKKKIKANKEKNTHKTNPSTSYSSSLGTFVPFALWNIALLWIIHPHYKPVARAKTSAFQNVLIHSYKLSFRSHNHQWFSWRPSSSSSSSTQTVTSGQVM